MGDVVKIKKNEAVPADLLLLSSSHPSGSCYIETSSLDGETSLKERSALRITQENLRLLEEYQQMAGYIRAERPNNNLYLFDGYLSTEEETVPLTINQLLLRGSTLKNTTYIAGLVLYTGEDTKIRLNATKPPTKFPTLEKTANMFILALFTLVVALAVILTTFSVFWEEETLALLAWYLPGTSLRLDVTNFFAYLILFNTLIPISLYVTLEFVRLCQAAYIAWDVELCDRETGQFAESRTSTLNEELGQVSYVFTDKTGTLTENKMIFRMCSVNGQAYRHRRTQAIPLGESSGVIANSSAELGKTTERRRNDIGFGPKQSTTLELTDRLRAESGAGVDSSPEAFQFLLGIALCHTVVPVVEDGNTDYQGPSPDEVALVQGAAEMEFKLVERSAETIVLKTFDEFHRFEILSVLDFTSARQRMSTIYRCPDGKIRIFCKGADSILYKLLADDTNLEVTREHVDHFAEGGHRILVYAYSEIEEDRFEKWRRIYQDAAVSMERRHELLSAACDLIERNLTLLGATAIEDRLQAGVPDTINSLLRAGIRVWMLTGDKLETAINVGHACSLINKDSQMVLLAHSDAEDVLSVAHKLQRGFRMVEEADGEHTVMVIDGHSLAKIVAEPELVSQMLSLGALVNAVVCCRVSPLQKAEVVNFVRHGMDKVTLAIGDGANDVSMIQAAHVGIGITGREGTQAARASDYSIAQFRFLKRLLLVHGHWNYVRVSKFFLGSFYKCMAFYLTQAAFQPFNGFSATSLYEAWTLASYNLFFSSVPVIFVGMFEKDLISYTLLHFPQLYQVGSMNQIFNVKSKTPPFSVKSEDSWTDPPVCVHNNSLCRVDAAGCLPRGDAFADSHPAVRLF